MGDHVAAAVPALGVGAAVGEQLTVAEVCALLRVNRSTFYAWRRDGRGPQCVVLPNRQVRVTRGDLQLWLAARDPDRPPTAVVTERQALPVRRGAC